MGWCDYNRKCLYLSHKRDNSSVKGVVVFILITLICSLWHQWVFFCIKKSHHETRGCRWGCISQGAVFKPASSAAHLCVIKFLRALVARVVLSPCLRTAACFISLFTGRSKFKYHRGLLPRAPCPDAYQPASLFQESPALISAWPIYHTLHLFRVIGIIWINYNQPLNYSCVRVGRRPGLMSCPSPLLFSPLGCQQLI